MFKNIESNKNNSKIINVNFYIPHLVSYDICSSSMHFYIMHIKSFTQKITHSNLHFLGERIHSATRTWQFNCTWWLKIYRNWRCSNKFKVCHTTLYAISPGFTLVKKKLFACSLLVLKKNLKRSQLFQIIKNFTGCTKCMRNAKKIGSFESRCFFFTRNWVSAALDASMQNLFFENRLIYNIEFREIPFRWVKNLLKALVLEMFYFFLD